MKINNADELKKELDLWSENLVRIKGLKPRGKDFDRNKPEKKQRSNKNVVLDSFYYKAYTLLDRIPPKRNMITDEEASIVGENLEAIFDEMVVERFNILRLIPAPFSEIMKNYKEYWNREV